MSYVHYKHFFYGRYYGIDACVYRCRCSRGSGGLMLMFGWLTLYVALLGIL